MLIIGDDFIPFEKIENIKRVEDIKNTSSNSTVVFGFSKEILAFCMKNGVNSGVKIASLKEAVFANALGAKYIVCPEEILQSVQKLADDYLFDSKILAVIENEEEIEKFALKNIDGVIYKNILR